MLRDREKIAHLMHFHWDMPHGFGNALRFNKLHKLPVMRTIVLLHPRARHRTCGFTVILQNGGVHDRGSRKDWVVPMCPGRVCKGFPEGQCQLATASIESRYKERSVNLRTSPHSPMSFLGKAYSRRA